MRRSARFLLMCVFVGHAAQAQDKQLVFPVPGQESSPPSARFFDEVYLAEEGVQHLGIDIPAPQGTEVVSPVDGTVVVNRTNVADPFAAYLVIRSEATGDEHVLAHIRSGLAASSAVTAGTPVGTIVTAGTGPHLHYGVNERGVTAAIDLSKGWGFGRAPKEATKADALARGWVDPQTVLDQAAAGQDVTDPGAAESSDWNQGLIAGVDVGYMPCGERRTTEACLRQLGFGDQAIAFSFAMDQDYSGATVGMAFTELGAVDLAGAEFIGADIYSIPVLMNGSFGLFPVGQTTDLRSAFSDATSQQMLRRFPEAFTDGMTIRSHRLLADGTQRFVLMESVVDGCRACDQIGSAVTFLEVGPATGGSLVRRPVGLLLGPPEATVDEMRADLFFTMPDSLQVWLNSLGYEAGAMDGRPGKQTRTALLEFQADYCLPATGALDDATARALLAADGFQQPCAGSLVTAPDQQAAGVAAAGSLPLLDGTYAPSTAACADPLSSFTLLGADVSFGESTCRISDVDADPPFYFTTLDCQPGGGFEPWNVQILSDTSLIPFAEQSGGTVAYQLCQAAGQAVATGESAPGPLPFPDGQYVWSDLGCSGGKVVPTPQGDIQPLSISGKKIDFSPAMCDVRAVTPWGDTLNVDLDCQLDGQRLRWEFSVLPLTDTTFEARLNGGSVNRFSFCQANP